MKKSLINYLGLLGIVSFLSYTAAVFFSPLAYPGYNWMAQAVSDLSAVNAPSRLLWEQLSSFYNVCTIVSVMAVCIFIKGKLNKPLRVGIYLFAAMEWVSAIGYTLFPLSVGGNTGGSFQDIMHVYVVTTLVVLLSIVSLVLIMAGGYRKKPFRQVRLTQNVIRIKTDNYGGKTSRTLAVWATIALVLMAAGAVGTGVVPKEFFGIPERFSVFAAAGFNAVLGLYLFKGIEE